MSDLTAGTEEIIIKEAQRRALEVDGEGNRTIPLKGFTGAADVLRDHVHGRTDVTLGVQTVKTIASDLSDVGKIPPNQRDAAITQAQNVAGRGSSATPSTAPQISIDEPRYQDPMMERGLEAKMDSFSR